MDAPASAGGGAPQHAPDRPLSGAERVKRFFLGPPRDLSDQNVLHQVSVAAFLAWVGLGADGLSSSSYGPEEAFRTLGDHRYLAVLLALVMIATVSVISACYSRIIERFPHGGGGYFVATALLGEKAGLVSGAALLVDYVLTITVSIAAAGDTLFSFLPTEWLWLKLASEAAIIIALTTTNLRGVKESIMTLLPVFLLFLATHAVLIGAGFFLQFGELPQMARDVGAGFQSGYATLGLGGMLLLFVHAYSLGGGTYTGIEAVSNGLPIMREPRVRTAKHTMVYMAVSLAVAAAGLILCYLLWNVQFEKDKTLNAVLAERIGEHLPFGGIFVILTLVSEGAILVVAAQAGFIAGPRVIANMASDGWAPRRFAALSDRLTTQNGILVMGLSALLALFYTHGDVRIIVVMYSINVFLTFSLSMLGMLRALLRERNPTRPLRGDLALFGTGLAFCATILAITVFAKFKEGGWITLFVTGALVALCFVVRRHYRALNQELDALYASLAGVPSVHKGSPAELDPRQPTAAILVGAYSGLGIHTTLAAFRAFPGHFRNVVFLSVGVLDSGAFREDDAMIHLKSRTEETLTKYVQLAHGQGLPAGYRMSIGTEVVSELEKLCLEVSKEFPRATFFAGQILFQKERWYQPILHNETAFTLQKRLQWAGQTVVILPARV